MYLSLRSHNDLLPLDGFHRPLWLSLIDIYSVLLETVRLRRAQEVARWIRMAEQQVQLTDLDPAQLQDVKKQLDQVGSSFP